MAAAFLDALDVQYDLFVDDEPTQRGAPKLDLDEGERAVLQ
jgi:hypothetical protein